MLVPESWAGDLPGAQSRRGNEERGWGQRNISGHGDSLRPLFVKTHFTLSWSVSAIFHVLVLSHPSLNASNLETKDHIGGFFQRAWSILNSPKDFQKYFWCKCVILKLESNMELHDVYALAARIHILTQRLEDWSDIQTDCEGWKDMLRQERLLDKGFTELFLLK